MVEPPLDPFQGHRVPSSSAPDDSTRLSTPSDWTDMASSGKKKTTMAKLMRESRLRERRIDKQARKDARKNGTAIETVEPDDTVDGAGEDTGVLDATQPALEAVVEG